MSGSNPLLRSKAAIIRGFFKACVYCVCLIFPTGVLANTEQPADYTVKAAYIFSFLKFIDWPESAPAKSDSSLIICSLGTSPLNYAVKALTGRAFRKRTLDVKEVHLSDDLSTCNVIVSDGVHPDQITPVFKKLDQQPILTVGESPNFARDLGVIGFTIIDERVKLEINLVRAKNKNIKLSAQLLEVAERIYRDGGQQ